MIDINKEEPTDEGNHASKEFLKNLGKRSFCYLRLRQTGSGNIELVDDVGCPVAGLKSYQIEQRSDGCSAPILRLEIYCSGIDVTT